MTTTTQNTTSNATEIAIGGYSPVSYFENGRAELGSPKCAVTHDGKTYHFTTVRQAETFRANPHKYLPEHGGACAYGAAKGETFPVDPTNFKIEDGRLLLFLKNDEVDARELWEQEHAAQCSTQGNGCRTC